MDLSPFKQDIDELIDEFAQGELTTLADMKRVWLSRKFSYIYEASPSTNLSFFMQSLYAHTIRHMVSNDSLSRRLGALYCLYCLYETQPFKPPFKIYISLGEFKKLKDLVVEAKNKGIKVVPALVKRMLEQVQLLYPYFFSKARKIIKKTRKAMAPSVEKQQKPSMAAEEEEETYSYAMQLASAIVLPAVLQAVTELDILEIINKAGPAAKLSASEIVSQIPNQNPEASMMLDRVLRLLVSYNVFHCSFVAGERLYSLAPVSKYFLRNQNGVSLLSFMDFTLDKNMFPAWFQLKNQILKGETSFDKVNGASIVEYGVKDSRFNEAFNNAMIGQSSVTMDKILESYKGFEKVKQLVDVGGGLGITLNMIISKYPHIKGINFDLPHVIKDAPSHPGVTHTSGDMYEKIPEGDTILMKWVFIGLDDDQCLKVLRNCYNTLPDDGKVLVIDAILPEVPENSAASREISILDTSLLILIGPAKQRTKQELNALATEAGFKGINYVFCACNFYVTEFCK